VWVCKYSATPTSGEKAQTVISVDWQPDREPGMSFNDAQGLSYVLSYDIGQPKPNKDTDCPTIVAVPTQPGVTDPCGLNNATWNVPADTAMYDWELLATGELVVHAQPGYMFTDGTFTHSYGLAPDRGVLCPVEITKVSVPAAPAIADPCGVANATWSLPANTTIFSWSISASGHLIVVITAPNTTFTDGSTQHDYGVAPDSGILCATAQDPTFSNPCGIIRDTYTIPQVSGIEYLVNNAVVAAGTYSTNGALTIAVTARAIAGYELTGGSSSWNLEFTNERCASAAEVSIATICTADGQYYGFTITNPTDSDQSYVMVVRNSAGIEVDRSPITTLSSGAGSTGSWLATTSGTYTFTLYSTNNDVIGVAVSEVTVTTTCASDVYTPNIFKVDQNGTILDGVLFSIKVCVPVGDGMGVISDWSCTNYSNVSLGKLGTWFKDNVQYDHYSPLTVEITETKPLQGCTSAGPWTATWQYNDEWLETGMGQMGSWNGDFTSNEWKLVNTCNPGKGGNVTPTPVVPVTTVTELPHTGPSNTVFVALIITLLTYAVAYVVQPKRSEEV
jgi:hypothetical protein